MAEPRRHPRRAGLRRYRGRRRATRAPCGAGRLWRTDGGANGRAAQLRFPRRRAYGKPLAWPDGSRGLPDVARAHHGGAGLKVDVLIEQGCDVEWCNLVSVHFGSVVIRPGLLDCGEASADEAQTAVRGGDDGLARVRRRSVQWICCRVLVVCSGCDAPLGKSNPIRLSVRACSAVGSAVEFPVPGALEAACKRHPSPWGIQGLFRTHGGASSEALQAPLSRSCRRVASGPKIVPTLGNTTDR